MGDHRRVPVLQTSILEPSDSEPRPTALLADHGEAPPFRSVLPSGPDLGGFTARARARLAWSSLLGLVSLAALIALGLIGIGRAASGVGVEDDPVSQGLAQDVPTRSVTVEPDAPAAAAQFGSERTSRARTTGEMSDGQDDAGRDRAAPVRRGSKPSAPAPEPSAQPAPGAEELAVRADAPISPVIDAERGLDTTYLVPPEVVNGDPGPGAGEGSTGFATPAATATGEPASDLRPQVLGRSAISPIGTLSGPPSGALAEPPKVSNPNSLDTGDDDRPQSQTRATTSATAKPVSPPSSTPTTSLRLTTSTTSSSTSQPAVPADPVVEGTDAGDEDAEPEDDDDAPGDDDEPDDVDDDELDELAIGTAEPPPTTAQEQVAVDSTTTTTKQATPAATRPGQYRAERRKALRTWIKRIRQAARERD